MGCVPILFKNPPANAKGLIFIYIWWSILDDFRNFCLLDNKKIYQCLK